MHNPGQLRQALVGEKEKMRAAGQSLARIKIFLLDKIKNLCYYSNSSNYPNYSNYSKPYSYIYLLIKKNKKRL